MKKIYLIAVISALLTAFSVYQFSQGLENKAKEQVEGAVNVVVAASNISQNTILTSDMLVVKQISKELISSNIATNLEMVIGKIVKFEIAKGEPIYTTRLYDIESTEGAQLSYELKKGNRAVTIGVDSVSGISGYLEKGDRVDLVAYFTKEGMEGQRVILENLLVLRVGTVKESETKGEYSTVTLEVSPPQADEINFIIANALIRLTLRSPLDQ